MLPSVMRSVVTVPAVLLSGAVALPIACAPASPAPVAVVAFGLDRDDIPFGESVDVTIQFDLAPSFEPLDEDYRVFLHVLDDRESFLWADDHDPPAPTSTWRPGQSIQYTRRVGIPPSPYFGPAVIAGGLYSPLSGARLPLLGDDLGGFTYRAATVVLEPPHERSLLAYESGWFPVEFNRTRQTGWRWTTGRAVLSLRNPRRDARLRLDVQGSPRWLDRPQRLALAVGGRTLRETTLNTNRRIHLDYELTTADLGDDDVVRLELVTDPTLMSPATEGGREDARELGIRVFDIQVELPPR